ncbi:Lpg1974 family pore-forming outer membrane protein [Lacipirellula parvula]|uniref:Uncharacterized protein n=1 Tax=Lacipirellula parvula TaxID=2650471 RepID=A0A5K7XDB2_9BACT|nr:Lpg1974 family pore-forming outer membrane protein [Lacipirellula parvula]BBO34784.1 hypothetical protein PLANPX_4396 [Lacipirellula parvula]
MKLLTWGSAALAVCLAMGSAAQLHAQSVGGVGIGGGVGGGVGMGGGGSLGASDFGSAMDDSGYGSYSSGGSCSTGDSGLFSLVDRNAQLVFGAEYIYAQATFSEALAYVEQNAIDGGETWHQIDFNYNSSYSFYGGVYLPDCGGSVIFDFTRLTSDGDYSASETTGVDIFGPFEIDGNINGHASVDLKSYDLSFAKTIPLGCLLGGAPCGDCCDDACCGDGSCGNGCGGGWCPAWDITWSGGIRYANVGWNNGLTATDPLSGAFIDSANTSLNFDGFGGRVGIMGRRYIGKRGLFSVYGRGDWSLLLGDVDINTTITNQAGSAFLKTSNQITVPVTEIELGASAHLGQHATLSAGYFWSAWHDLGMSPEYNFDQFQISHYDDSNILGWNGLFGRVEVAF